MVQTKFVLRSGESIFTHKYQDLNGKLTNIFNIDGKEFLEEEYKQRFKSAENEELEMEEELLEKKRQEELLRQQKILEAKKKEEERFLEQSKILVLKKLVNLEIKKVNNSFEKLNKYDLKDYFCFDKNSFESQESLNYVKADLLDNAKKLVICNEGEIKFDDLNEMLQKLETVPGKIDRFFRQSVKKAINCCSDTKKLKEWLALM